MPNYPILRFLERHGDWVAIVLALVPLAVSIWAVLAGQTPAWLAVGVGAGLLAYLLFKSYVELIRVMIDMLLPK